MQTDAVLKKSKRKQVSYKVLRLAEAPWESWWAGGLGGRLTGTEVGVRLGTEAERGGMTPSI